MKFLRIFGIFMLVFGFVFNGAFAEPTGPVYSFLLNDSGGSGGKVHADSFPSSTVGWLNYGYAWGYYDSTHKWYTITDIAQKPTSPDIHHSFGGYYTGQNKTGTQVVSSSGQFNDNSLTSITADDTPIYAYWAPQHYRIILNDNGGAGSEVVDPQYYSGWGLFERYGACYIAAQVLNNTEWEASVCVSRIHQTPTRSGYDFAGYTQYSNGTGARVINADGTVNDATSTTFTSSPSTIYAQWTPKVFTVTLNHQSPTNSPAPSTVYLKYATNWYSDSSATTPIYSMTTLPIKTNYDFGGYWTGVNGSGIQVIDSNGNFLRTQEVLTAITSNTTIYAKWTVVIPAVYTITLNPNGGSGTHTIWYSNGNYYCDSGVAQNIALNASVFTTCDFSAPTSTNNEFNGYYSNQSTGTQYIGTDGKLTVAAQNLNINTNTTWYAHYATCDSMIVLNPDGGNFSGTCANEFYPYYDSTTGQWMTPTLNAGCKPTLAGYTFMGYRVTSQNGVKYYDSNLNINIPVWGLCSLPKVELVAEWTGNCNEITFDDNNGMTSVNANNSQHKRTGSPDWWGVNATPSDPCGKIYEGTTPTVNVPSGNNVPAHATFTGYYTTRDTGGSMIFNTSGVATTYGTNTWIISAPTTLYARWECDTGYGWDATTHTCEQNTFSVKYMCYLGDTTGKTDQATATNYTVRAMNWYEQCNINGNNPVPNYKWRFSGDNNNYSAGDTISNWMYGNDKTFVPSYTATFNCDTNYWQTPSGGAAPASQSVVLGGSIIMPGMSCEVKPEFDGWLETNYTWKTSYTQNLTTPVPEATCATYSNDLHFGPGDNFNWQCPTDLTFEPLVKFVNKPVTVSCGVGGNTQTFNMTYENQNIIEQSIIDWYATNCTGTCPLTNPSQYPQGYNRKIVCAMNWGTQTLPDSWEQIENDSQGRVCYKTGANVTVQNIINSIDVAQITDLNISGLSYCPQYVKYKCGENATDVYNLPPYAVFEREYTTLTHETVGCQSGYEFDNWKVENEDVYYNENQTVAEWSYEDEVTLVAQWGDAIDYTVTYTCGAGTGANTTDTATYGVDYTVLNLGQTNCTYPGHNFTGWKLNINSTTYQGGDHFIWNHTTSNSTFTAQWGGTNTYTITYKPNYDGATQNNVTQNVEYGDEFVTKPANTFTRTGYIIIKWGDDATTPSVHYPELNTQYTYDTPNNKDLFALWRQCDDGTQPNADGTECVPCPEGTAGTGGTCEPCPDGTQPNAAGTECVPCPEGTAGTNGTCEPCTGVTVPNTNGTACEPCPDGYQPNATHTACIPCPAGTYGTGGTCEPCPNGYVSDEGATTCTPCPAGTYEYNNQCVPCDPGYISGSGATACIPCPADTYWIDGTTCEDCPEGYSSAPASTSIDQCILSICPTGEHIEHGECVSNTKSCDAPYATIATRTWNTTLSAYGSCQIVECDDGYHIASNACVPNDALCTVANGRGERIWNGNAWGACENVECDPGFVANSTGTACERCSNYIGDDGQPAVSSYISGCEIASCMYQGQKYALEGDECTSICEDATDDTGSKYWNETTHKCVRTCNPGYKMW